MIPLPADKTQVTVPLEFTSGADFLPAPTPIGGNITSAGERAGTAVLNADGRSVTFTRGRGSGQAVVSYSNTELPGLRAELIILVEAVAEPPPPPPPPPLVADRVIFREDLAEFS